MRTAFSSPLRISAPFAACPNVLRSQLEDSSSGSLVVFAIFAQLLVEVVLLVREVTVSVALCVGIGSTTSLIHNVHTSKIVDLQVYSQVSFARNSDHIAGDRIAILLHTVQVLA